MGDVVLAIVCVGAIGLVLGVSLWAGGHPKKRLTDDAKSAPSTGDGGEGVHHSDSGDGGGSHGGDGGGD
jgi:hypothetical protein